MYLMYVDESGDPGLSGHASEHYILSGIIVEQNDWDKFLDKLIRFRKYLKKTYGLNQRTEIHTSELIRINKIEEYRSITKTARINIIKDYCTYIPQIFDTAKIINICIRKKEHPERDIFDLAWSRLLQRYDTFLKKSANNEKGVVIADDTNSTKLRILQRKMRVFNPVKSHFQDFHNVPIDNIIEDGFMRDSRFSYFVQSADLVSHVLFRSEFPKGSLRKFGLEKEFCKLESILLKEASKKDPYGIVREIRNKNPG